MMRRLGLDRSRFDADGGSALISTAVGVVVLLVAVSSVFNVVVHQYGRGVVRTGLDEAVQAGSVVSPEGGEHLAACRQRYHEATDVLLAGSLGDQVGDVRCWVTDGRIYAETRARFPNWSPWGSDDVETLQASAHLEVAP
ncbi:MAG: hypothetical protein IT198_14095 [Acidimicrobiia bacterium]|nr:hypothetical protein [Acidimicrobiia bacterium]